MPIALKSANVVYFSVPKCACSSLKLFFFRLRSGKPWAKATRKEGEKTIHDRFPSVAFKSVKQKPIAEFEKVAVVRSPVDRVKSCYTNKVLGQKILHRKRAAMLLKPLRLTPDPDFETFVQNLGKYRTVSGPIKRHTEPLSHWLGDDPEYFDHLFDISELDKLQNLVNTRRNKNTVKIAHANKTKAHVERVEVSDALRQTIEKLYQEDLALFGSVFDRNQIK